MIYFPLNLDTDVEQCTVLHSLTMLVVKGLGNELLREMTTLRLSCGVMIWYVTFLEAPFSSGIIIYLGFGVKLSSR